MTTAQERPMTEIPEPLEWTTRLDLDPSWDVPTAKKDLLVLSLRIDQRFSATRAILDGHDLRFTSIESRLTKIENRLDIIDQRLNTIDERLTSLERSASTSRLAIYVSGAIGILGIISQHITF
jgi:hypothetical protein